MNRVIYNVQSVFVGPAPATGFNFLDYEGTLNNNSDSLCNNHNLLQKIDRVISATYEFDVERSDIKQLGRYSNVARPIINQPNVKIDLNYLLNGVKNEARIGLDVNYAQFQHPYSGEAYYPSRISPISGMVSPSFIQPTEDPFWPHRIRETRNIYLVTCPEGEDLHQSNEEDFVNPSINLPTDPRVTGFHVLAFGDCYLDSYSVSASVGSIPRASVSFIGDNAVFYSSGTGIDIPAVNPRTRELVSGVKIVIPNVPDEGGPSVLRPGDMVLDITGIEDIAINLNDAKINGFAANLNLNRESLGSLGYKNAICRKINFPLFVAFSFEMIVGEGATGSLGDLLRKDKDYDITVKFKNTDCESSTWNNSPSQSGPYLENNAVAIRYDFLKSKFEGVSYNSQIGSSKTAQLNFTTEIDPRDYSRGFFISGLLNIAKIEDFLLFEDNGTGVDDGVILLGDDDPIVTNLIPLF